MYNLQEMSGRLHLPSAPWHLRVSPSCIRPRTTCIGGPSPACLALPCPRPHHNLHQQHRTLRGRDCAVRAGSCCSAASEPPQQNSNTTHEHQHGNHSHFPDSFLTGFFERLGLVAAAERITHSSACLWAAVLGFFCGLFGRAPRTLSTASPRHSAPAGQNSPVHTLGAVGCTANFGVAVHGSQRDTEHACAHGTGCAGHAVHGHAPRGCIAAAAVPAVTHLGGALHIARTRQPCPPVCQRARQGPCCGGGRSRGATSVPYPTAVPGRNRGCGPACAGELWRERSIGRHSCMGHRQRVSAAHQWRECPCARCHWLRGPCRFCEPGWLLGPTRASQHGGLYTSTNRTYGSAGAGKQAKAAAHA
mmetsp:Transcript_1694/g.4230  ORF Transcript_1694/g.4230 Transcript_1694/m.4230 type:complete len:361 (+) Transcript_1694:154-1236(+)